MYTCLLRAIRGTYDDSINPYNFQAPTRSVGRRRGSEDRKGIELDEADRMCCGVAPEGSVVSGLARGTAYKGAALPRVLAFLLFVLGILSGNRRIELSSCTAPTE
jgi:hypothetical protein